MNAANLYSNTSTSVWPKLQLVSRNPGVSSNKPVVRQLRSIAVGEGIGGGVATVFEYETNKGPFILWKRAA